MLGGSLAKAELYLKLASVFGRFGIELHNMRF